MYSAEEASQTSGIREIWEASEFEPFLRALRNRQPYRPKADKILKSESATPVESSAPFGFEKLFVEAGKNDAYIYLLVPGMSDSWNTDRSSASLRNGRSQLQVTASRMRRRSLRRCVCGSLRSRLR